MNVFRFSMCLMSKFSFLMRLIICLTKTDWVIRPYVLRSTSLGLLIRLNTPFSFSFSLLPRKGIQIILFSATFPDHVRTFASKFAPNANKIELQKEELSVDNIRQFYMDCKNEEHKYDILVSLYQLLTIGQSIIFCQVSDLAKKS
jgi:hypothetical protein